jgi:hypothetical protein
MTRALRRTTMARGATQGAPRTRDTLLSAARSAVLQAPARSRGASAAAARAAHG